MDKVRRPVFKNGLSTTLLSSRSKEFLSLLGGCEENDRQMPVQASCNSGYRYSRLYLRSAVAVLASLSSLKVLASDIGQLRSAMQSERLTRHAMACQLLASQCKVQTGPSGPNRSKVLNLIGCQWDPSFTQGLADGTDCWTTWWQIGTENLHVDEIYVYPSSLQAHDWILLYAAVCLYVILWVWLGLTGGHAWVIHESWDKLP